MAYSGHIWITVSPSGIPMLYVPGQREPMIWQCHHCGITLNDAPLMQPCPRADEDLTALLRRVQSYLQHGWAMDNAEWRRAGLLNELCLRLDVPVPALR